MIGKLDPEERVMKDVIKDYWSISKDKFFAWKSDGIMDRIQDFIETLGWDSSDNIAVEIGGTCVYEIDGAGTKWAPKKGTRNYNKDAFIVIKNLDRNPVMSSQPNPELKQHHTQSQ
jgi:hypothetical protein